MSDVLERRLKQLQAWGMAARILLAVDLVASGLLVAGIVAQAAGWASGAGFVIFLGLTGLIGGLASLLTLPTICIWIYRAHANLRVFGAEELNYSPGWAVGSFFVPVINFVVPFRAMRELYNRSIGEPAHFADNDASDVSAWWTTFVANLLITSYFSMVAIIELRTPFFLTTPPMAVFGMRMVAIFLWAMSTVFLMRIIKTISTAQRSVSGVTGVFA